MFGKKTEWIQKTVHHPGVGPVDFVRCGRAKYLRLTIRPESTVRLTLPRRVSVEEAQRFLRSRTDWIRGHLERIREERARRQEQPTLSNQEFIAAQRRLIDRLCELAAAHGFRFNRVTMRCQKTRWGSCSGLDNINLNVNLIFLPAHLQDYVLLHELSHLRHRNHGRQFWDELSRLCNTDAKALQKELGRHTMRLL